MFYLLKQNAQINSILSYLSIAVIVCLAYLVAIPPTFLFIVSTVAIPIFIFYYDDKNKVNRFVVSLPIEKKTLISSKYIFMFVLALTILLFQMMIMFTFSALGNGLYMYDWRDIIVLICSASIIIAICIPIFYFIKSFMLATGIIMGGTFLGTFLIMTPLINVLGMKDVIIFNDLDPGLVLLVEKYIPFQPYFMLGVLSLIIFYLSMKLSEKLLSYKDI